MAGAFTGSLYALTLDPESADGRERVARLVHVHSGGRSVVAVFSDEGAIARWRAETAPGNSVLRPLAFHSIPEMLEFLADLVANGDTDVCFNPSRVAGAFLPISDLMRKLGEIA